MSADTHQIVTLFVFFTGAALCVWRWPQGDRWHVILCFIAAALWCSLLLFEPRTRTSGYGLIVSNFLLIGFTRPFRRHSDRRC